MKKSFRLFLAMLLVGGSALTFSSCKDNESVSDTPVTPEEIAQSKETEAAKSLLRVLSFTAGLDSLPDNWYANNYTVEPLVGTVVDASTPFVRYIPVLDKAEAIAKYNSFSGKIISQDATSDSWNVEGVGSMNFQAQNQADVFATLDVNIKQQPHLTQIRFVPESAMGSNSSIQGKPYYSFGDIVYTEEGKKGGKRTYWICVRPCSKKQGKGMSHWMSFQLNDYGSNKTDGVASGNVNFTNFTKSKVEYYLPTKLGNESGSLEHLQNLFKLLNVLNNPTRYNEAIYANGIGGIDKDELSQATVQLISDFWAEKDYWSLVLPGNVKRNQLNTCFTQDQEINVFYNGYHKSDPSVYWAQLSSADLSLLRQGEYSLKGISQNLDFRGCCENGYINLSTPVQGFPQKGFIVRYKTGGQMKGDWTAFYDDEAPLESFSIKHSNIHDVFVYNNVRQEAGMGVSVMGDVIKNPNDVNHYEHDSYYDDICVLNNSINAPDTWKGSSYYFQYQEEDGRVIMQDLETSKQAYVHLLNAYMRYWVDEYNNSSGNTKFNVKKLPKFSDNYERGLYALRTNLDKASHERIEKVVDMLGYDKNGVTAIGDNFADLDKITILMAFADSQTRSGYFNTAKLTYCISTGKYTISDIKRNVKTMGGFFDSKSHLCLKSYIDAKSEIPVIAPEQTYEKAMTYNRQEIKEESCEFLNSHKVELQ